MDGHTDVRTDERMVGQTDAPSNKDARPNLEDINVLDLGRKAKKRNVRKNGDGDKETSEMRRKAIKDYNWFRDSVPR